MREGEQLISAALEQLRHLGLQRADSKICSTDWNRLRVCRSALVETWPMLGLSCDSLQPTGPGSASGVHVLVTIFALKGRNENQTPGMCHKSVLCRAPCRELVQFKYINCSD